MLVSERLAATGRMAHTIAHEINNPLEAITNLVYLLQGSLDKPEVARRYLDSTAAELARVSRIARQILAFNRESSSPVEIRIGELVDDVLALNNRALVDKHLHIRKDWNTSLVIEGFPAQLRQVFSNLVRNAIKASFPNGEIRIKISPTRPRRSQTAVRVTVADQGIGIRPENMKRIFDAFFTTKDLKGSRVRGSLSSSIVQEHGGYIRAHSCTRRSESGTCLSACFRAGQRVVKRESLDWVDFELRRRWPLVAAPASGGRPRLSRRGQAPDSHKGMATWKSRSSGTAAEWPCAWATRRKVIAPTATPMPTLSCIVALRNPLARLILAGGISV